MTTYMTTYMTTGFAWSFLEFTMSGIRKPSIHSFLSIADNVIYRKLHAKLVVI